MIILIIILIIIVIIEFSSIFINGYFDFLINKTESDIKINKDVCNFTEYIMNDSIRLSLKSGYIYTEMNNNLFLINNDKFTLMNPHEIYYIDNDFILDFIMLDTSTIYYYCVK